MTHFFFRRSITSVCKFKVKETRPIVYLNNFCSISSLLTSYVQRVRGQQRLLHTNPVPRDDLHDTLGLRGVVWLRGKKVRLRFRLNSHCRVGVKTPRPSRLTSSTDTYGRRVLDCQNSGHPKMCPPFCGRYTLL